MTDIRGVVFDLDNTLLQSRLGAAAGLRVAASEISQELRKHGRPFSKLQVLRKLARVERVLAQLEDHRALSFSIIDTA